MLQSSLLFSGFRSAAHSRTGGPDSLHGSLHVQEVERNSHTNHERRRKLEKHLGTHFFRSKFDFRCRNFCLVFNSSQLKYYCIAFVQNNLWLSILLVSPFPSAVFLGLMPVRYPSHVAPPLTRWTDMNDVPSLILRIGGAEGKTLLEIRAKTQRIAKLVSRVDGGLSLPPPYSLPLLLTPSLPPPAPSLSSSLLPTFSLLPPSSSSSLPPSPPPPSLSSLLLLPPSLPPSHTNLQQCQTRNPRLGSRWLTTAEKSPIQ